MSAVLKFLLSLCCEQLQYGETLTVLTALFQDGVGGGEDADELVHVPTVQVPEGVRGGAALHALPGDKGASRQGTR